MKSLPRAKEFEAGRMWSGEVGVAEIEVFIIFVANTKKGQHIRFKITSVGSRFAIGELV